ncbi:MAG: hypothetical protein DIU71_17180 [Proteobacteria bacterium]|nr:MAG: hypothetical protein DIU71_17180 [Pseudomonadota bacterium]
MIDRDHRDAPPGWLLDGRGGARLLDPQALERWRPHDGLIAGLFGGNISTLAGNVLGMRHPLWFVGLCLLLALLGWGLYLFFRRWWSP